VATSKASADGSELVSFQRHPVQRAKRGENPTGPDKLTIKEKGSYAKVSNPNYRGKGPISAEDYTC